MQRGDVEGAWTGGLALDGARGTVADDDDPSADASRHQDQGTVVGCQISARKYREWHHGKAIGQSVSTVWHDRPKTIWDGIAAQIFQDRMNGSFPATGCPSNRRHDLVASCEAHFYCRDDCTRYNRKPAQPTLSCSIHGRIRATHKLQRCEMVSCAPAIHNALIDCQNLHSKFPSLELFETKQFQIR